MATLRQQKLMEALPESGYNIAEAARRAGYAASTVDSKIYGLVRNGRGFREFFTPDTVKRDIRKVKKLVLKKEDYTNFLRATELESKILGMQVDRSEVRNLTPEKIIIAYGQPGQAVEVKPGKSE